jgi:hypothetical protein
MSRPFVFEACALYLGEPSDPDQPEYRYYISTAYAAGAFVADCWCCDENLNLRPGYENCPEPRFIGNMKKIVRRRVEPPAAKRGGWLG